MAFRIRHTQTGLFWSSGVDQKIRLSSEASKYAFVDSILKNADTGLNVMHAACVVHESTTHPTAWNLSEGVLSSDSMYATWDSSFEVMRASATPEVWEILYDAAVEVPKPIADPVPVPEPAPEAAAEAEAVSDSESVPDLVTDDEDVPVARSAALIEEALNAAAADAAEEESEDEVGDAPE